MTEINTTLRSNPQQRQRPSDPEVTIASANRLPGLGSGLPTDQTINTIIQVERRRLIRLCQHRHPG